MNRRSIACVWVAVLAACLLAGCSDSPPRQAGQNLRDQVAESQRAFEKALTLLNNPVFGRLDSTAVVPLKSLSIQDSNNVKLYPPDYVNPIALKCLDASALEKALAENVDAEAPDRMAALCQAGHVYKLKGMCHAWQASSGRRAAESLLWQAAVRADDLQSQTAALRYVSSYLDAPPADAAALIASAQKQADEKGAQIKGLDDEITKLKGDVEAARGKVDALSKESASLRLESKANSGKKALDLAEQAIDKQDQAGKASIDLAAAESKLAAKEAERKTVAAEQALAQSLLAIGQNAKQSYEKLMGDLRKKKEEIQASIAEGLKKLDAIAGDGATLVADLKDVRKNEDDAAAAFEQAAKRFDQAQSLAAGDSALPAATGYTASRSADVRLAQGKLARESLALRADLDEFAARMKGLWPQLGQSGELPGAYAKLGADYLGDPAKTREAAAKICLEAVDGYRKLVMRAGENVRWTYQALVGTSYISLYELTRDRADIEHAVSELAEAVKDKEFSPYLLDAVESQRLAQRMLESAAPAASPK